MLALQNKTIIAHLVIKYSSFPWFHQEAIALMGVIRFITLFIYLFIHSFTHSFIHSFFNVFIYSFHSSID